MRMPGVPSKPAMGTVAGRVVGIVVLLTVAMSSGAAIGMAGGESPLPKATPLSKPGPGAAEGSDLQATLAVSEPPARTAAAAAGTAAGGAPAAGKGVSAPILKFNIPSLDGGPAGAAAGGGGAVRCSRFDDAKIGWLMEQVSKTRAEHPEMAAGADRLLAALQGALGKNLCASEAQAIIGQLCGDPAVVRVMNQMVSELPFFIKPMVGDPCSADLVSVLNKVGKFVPWLSSEPS